ncbi:MAG: arylesterase [Pseudomonadales bacterium]|nr:arylesterase [Pseudomonadales bacterium]MBO6656773.1 arylesterase [Pseudomonadales bacterium]MBO6702513.1 arylesterase [Pseudomonadales bacterium]MBO7005906.1 arylesterase [Pseudomonadales bacterium]
MLRLITLFITLLCHSTGTFANGGTILVYGDSISAAYGMNQEQGWVSLLSERLNTEHPGYRVVNASVSGETTGGGLTRLPKSLSLHQPDVLVLELGGNDGLRGYPIDKIRGNLDAMIQQSKEAGTRVLLIGMVLPPNYGRRYITAFEQIFTDLANLHQVPFVPFLLNGVATTRDLVQRDGIHPTVDAQPMILEDVYPVLESLL